jgi:hypothetical protein
MDTKNVTEHGGWFASYLDDNERQAKALILCQQKKIAQLEGIIEAIKGETELSENPTLLLHSIRAMIDDIPKVEHTEGVFKWIA